MRRDEVCPVNAELKRKRKSFWQVQGFWLLTASLLVTLLVGITVVASVKSVVQAQIARRLEGAVGLVADQIDSQIHAQIRTRADEDSAAYNRLVGVLRRAQVRMKDIRFVYTYRVDSRGRVVFAVDAESNPAKKSHVGDVYAKPTAAMLAAARPPYPVVIESEISEDQWGSWLSGFAPVLSPSGRLEAVVGIDMAAHRVREIQREYLVRIGVGGLLLASVMAAVGALLAVRISRPVLAVSRDLGLVGRLNFDGNPSKASRVAEVVSLQDSVERMKKGLLAFRRYVPADLVAELLTLKGEPVLGGEKKQLTVFFSDIANFTATCEAMDPEKLSRFLSAYFEVVTTTISKYGGIVDKYMGDGVMAFWNAPRNLDDHPYRALMASLEIQQKFAILKQEFEKRGWSDFQARIGLATGRAMVGNVGYSERLAYTALGDTVNLASRIEGLNKHFGTSVLISEETARLVGDRILCREVDLVYVHGRHSAVSVFVPHGPAEQIMPRQREALRLYAQGLQLYRNRQWEAACDAFREFLYAWPDDGPATKLFTRCSDYLKFPPDKSWDGAVRLTLK